MNSIGYLFFGKVIAFLKAFSLERFRHPDHDHPGKLMLFTHFIEERHIVESELSPFFFRSSIAVLNGFATAGWVRALSFCRASGYLEDTVA